MTRPDEIAALASAIEEYRSAPTNDAIYSSADVANILQHWTDRLSATSPGDAVREALAQFQTDSRLMRDLRRHFHTRDQGMEIRLERASAKVDAALAPAEKAVVSIQPMALSHGRTDYFVSIRCGDREVTPHVFSEEYKAAYHVALYDWLLNGSGEEPDVVDFGPDDWPARVVATTEKAGGDFLTKQRVGVEGAWDKGLASAATPTPPSAGQTKARAALEQSKEK
jgi:hypothetical protein